MCDKIRGHSLLEVNRKLVCNITMATQDSLNWVTMHIKLMHAKHYKRHTKVQYDYKCVHHHMSF